ncbi:hypothetical protein Drorol1_Dr00027171 [Drosera rotundifolia]
MDFSTIRKKLANGSYSYLEQFEKVDVEDDEDMEPLRARLAAYNLDSSPDNSVGRDTTSSTLACLFWLLSNNPESESKIVEEEKVIFQSKAPSSHAEIENQHGLKVRVFNRCD